MNHADTEAALLAVVMSDSASFWKVSDLLTADDFASAAARKVWEVLADEVRAGGAVDAITLSEKYPELQQAIFGFTSSFGTVALVRAYAERIVTRAVERRVVAAGQRIAQLRGDGALAEAQRILASCSPRNTDAVKHIKTFLKQSIKGLQARYESTELLSGLATSIPELDEMTAGWQRSDLIILAGRPSLGKTALALQCALHAVRGGTPVLFFSAEMAGQQLTDRSLAYLSRVSLARILKPKLMTDEDWSNVNEAAAELQSLPFFVDDSSGMTIDAISARARQLDADNRLGLVVIDYLTHLTLPRGETVAESIQTATRMLKGLAKDLKVPVILLSQLNRDGDQKPSLATLRGSGAIEQDADVIGLLHRPDPQRRDLVTLELAKQRNGACGEIWLNADMEHMRFLPTDERPHAPEPRGFKRSGFGKDRAVQPF